MVVVEKDKRMILDSSWNVLERMIILIHIEKMKNLP